MKNLKLKLVVVMSFISLNSFAQSSGHTKSYETAEFLCDTAISTFNRVQDVFQMNNRITGYEYNDDEGTVSVNTSNRSNTKQAASDRLADNANLQGMSQKDMDLYLDSSTKAMQNTKKHCASKEQQFFNSPTSTGNGGVAAGATSDYSSSGLPQGQGRGLKNGRGATEFSK